ncbi:MAG: GNAT family N-acetyltransferase [Thermomicrobiales bacterium]|nr:GNAT family N-acetyltransferase [Thermomicrobiales bacterium]
MVTELVRTVTRVDEEGDAVRTLDYLGRSFFGGYRLAKFALDSWSLLGRSESVDWADPNHSARPIVEIWRQSDHAGRTLGAMTLHYYHWNRIRRQHYFSLIPNPRQPKRSRIFVLPFEELISRELGIVTAPSVAVELGYFAVSPEARGEGIGSAFFDTFLDRAKLLAPDGNLAFTIVMARHAHMPWGAELMGHLIERGATSQQTSILMSEVGLELNHPADLWDVADHAQPTAWLAERRGLDVVGYGKNLGQVWAGRSGQVSLELPFEMRHRIAV